VQRFLGWHQFHQAVPQKALAPLAVQLEFELEL
jgi:hypothetical protein